MLGRCVHGPIETGSPARSRRAGGDGSRDDDGTQRGRYPKEERAKHGLGGCGHLVGPVAGCVGCGLMILVILLA